LLPAWWQATVRGDDRKPELTLMPAYCVFDIREIMDPAALETYRGRVLATVKQYGGRYVFVGGRFEVIEGDWRPAFPVIIEFPSLEQAHRWYGSEDYRDLKEMRLAATRSDVVFMEGVMDGFR
jgi:uncharacterized protein (DUF1330 family)